MHQSSPTIIKKHLCIRHDGMMTIIPDALSIAIHETGVVVTRPTKDGKPYRTKCANFHDVEEIISPYKQE